MRPRQLIAAAGVAAACALLAACTGSSGGSPSTTPLPASDSATPGPSASPPSPSPSPSSSSPTTGGSGTAGPVHQQLHDFRIYDATFVGSHEWVFGSADCLSGAGRCDAIETSSDGGRTWHSAPAPAVRFGDPGNGGCDEDCVSHLRFASARVGYAWGSSLGASHSFFMTTDGGSSWQHEPGRVVALSASDGDVVRVTGQNACPPGCTYRVQVASVGSTSWHTVHLPGPVVYGDSAQLDRAAGVSYLLIGENPAGGGDDERSTLYVSSDGGRSWTRRGEPCPQVGAHGEEVDSSLLTVAPDGSAAVLCRARIGDGRQFVATTSDDGASFRAGSRTALGSADVTGFGAASSSVLLISLGDTFRSTDGGETFTRLAANGGSSPGDPSYIGFASSTLGHAIAGDRRVLFTTTAGGATWTAHRFS